MSPTVYSLVVVSCRSNSHDLQDHFRDDVLTPLRKCPVEVLKRRTLLVTTDDGKMVTITTAMVTSQDRKLRGKPPKSRDEGLQVILVNHRPQVGEGHRGIDPIDYG